MNFYKHSSYLEFSKVVKEASINNTNLLLVSVPGMSVTFYIKKFFEHENNQDYSYIDSEGESLSKFNFLDLNFNTNDNALELAQNYFKKSGLKQKFALAINTPYLLDSEDFKKSIIGSHFYKTYYYKVLDKDLISIFASILNVKLSTEKLNKVFDLSGGLTRIVKFLLTNQDVIDKPANKIIDNSDFKRVFLPTAQVIERCSKETLEKLGIIEKNEFVGEICKLYFKRTSFASSFDIDIKDDMTFNEKSIMNKNVLLKIEKQVLTEALANNGIVSKEKVAEFKWGEGSYDKYSDQAIKKTMQRINSKLRKYKFEAIRTVGYKLIEK